MEISDFYIIYAILYETVNSWVKEPPTNGN